MRFEINIEDVATATGESVVFLKKYFRDRIKKNRIKMSDYYEFLEFLDGHKTLKELSDEIKMPEKTLYYSPQLTPHMVKFHGRKFLPNKIYETYKQDILERRKLQNPKWLNNSGL